MKIIKLAIYSVALMVLFGACKDAAKEITEVHYPRAFAPIDLAKEVSANEADLTWKSIDAAVSYVVELSEGDSLLFDNIIGTWDVDGATALNITGLSAKTPYSARVKAKAFEAQQDDSKWAGIFFKTPAGADPDPDPVGYHRVTNGEEFQTTSANITASDWVTYAKANYAARTVCLTGDQPNLSATDRIVEFKMIGAASFTISGDGNSAVRVLRYRITLIDATPDPNGWVNTAAWPAGCSTQTFDTGSTGACTLEISGNSGSVYLSKLVFATQ